MTIESQQREIGGALYEVTPLDGDEGSELMLVLAKHFLPALSGAVASIASSVAAAKSAAESDASGAAEGQGGADPKATPAELLGDVVKVGAGDIMGAVVGVVKSLSVEDFRMARNAFAKRTRVHRSDGTTPFLKDCLRQHFAAKYPDMLLWMAFCLEVNYGPFFVGLLPSATQKPGNASSSPKTSG